MLTVALGWQVYSLTGDVLDLGWVGLIEFAPRLLFLFPSGSIADRFDRSRVLFVTRCSQAILVALLGWGAWQGWADRTVIFAMAFLLGSARTFEMPTTQALLPQLVKPHQLAKALAIGASSLQAATIVSPALAGFLYVLGPGPVYGLAAIGYAVASLMILRLPHRSNPQSETPLKDRKHEFLAGIRYILHRPAVMGAISLDLFAVLLGGATALLPAVARDILHTGPWGLGILRSAPAVGALVISLWLARNPPRHRVGLWMFGAVALYGLATLVFGASRSFPISLIALIAMGCGDMVSVVIRSSLIQLETPDTMRGRVSAVSSLFIGASNQLGEFESGVTAKWLGVAPAILLGGLGTLVVTGLWMYWFPSLTKRDTLVATADYKTKT